MSLLQNQRAFWMVGGAIMIGSVIAAAVLSGQNPSRNAATTSATRTATATPTIDPNATPTPTPDPNATPTATPAPKTFSQAEQVIDASKKYTATLRTDKGDIVMNLFADKAPRTVNTFVFLVQNGFYDGITVHRAEAGQNFSIVQVGDPTGTGSGGPGFATEEDPNDLKNTRGMVSMAKAGPVTTFGSQLFINRTNNPGLDTDTPNQRRFYPWAEVTAESMAVVDQIVRGDVIRSATIKEEAR